MVACPGVWQAAFIILRFPLDVTENFQEKLALFE